MLEFISPPIEHRNVIHSFEGTAGIWISDVQFFCPRNDQHGYVDFLEQTRFVASRQSYTAKPDAEPGDARILSDFLNRESTPARMAHDDDVREIQLVLEFPGGIAILLHRPIDGFL